MRTRDLKALYEEVIEDYWEVRGSKFRDAFVELIATYGTSEMTEGILTAFMDDFMGTYPEEDTWAWREVDSSIATEIDRRYEESKDIQC